MEIQDMDEVRDCTPDPILTVVVAVNGSKNSKNAVKWALEKFIPEGIVFFRILHVRPKITHVPSPMGYLPISEVREDVALAHQKDMNAKQTQCLFLIRKYVLGDRLTLYSFRRCRKYMKDALDDDHVIETIVIESDNVAEAISGEIDKFKLRKLVIGNVMRTKCHPESPKTLLSVRTPASASATDEIPRVESISSFPSLSLSSNSSSIKSEWSETDAATSTSGRLDLLTIQRSQALAAMNYNVLNVGSVSGGTLISRSLSSSTDENFRSFGSSTTEGRCTTISISQSQSFQMDKHSHNFDQASTSKSVTSENQFDVDFELEKLRIELKLVQGMCQSTQDESNEVSQQISELTRLHEDKLVKLKELELSEEILIELARQERERRAAAEAEAEAELVRQRAEREASQKRNAEYSASRETDEKLRLERALCDTIQKVYMGGNRIRYLIIL